MCVPVYVYIPHTDHNHLSHTHTLTHTHTHTHTNTHTHATHTHTHIYTHTHTLVDSTIWPQSTKVQNPLRLQTDVDKQQWNLTRMRTVSAH